MKIPAPEYADITLRAEASEYRVHSAVLAIESEVFLHYPMKQTKEFDLLDRDGHLLSSACTIAR